MKKLYLENGQAFEGKSIGAETEMMGEVVFTTGMTGYLETLTDPSYYGQIIVFTFPLIGNYGVFENSEFTVNSSQSTVSRKKTENFKKTVNHQPSTVNSQTTIDETFESSKIWVRGVIMTEVSEAYSHCQAYQSFCQWLKDNDIPALTAVDTREITQILREEGCILGAIADTKPTKFEDPLNGRYVPEVSPKGVTILDPVNSLELTVNSDEKSTSKKTVNRQPSTVDCVKTIAFIDCGAKNGIFRNFLKRGIRVIRMPFDTDPFEWVEQYNSKIKNQKSKITLDGIFFSNGPGDPETVVETIATMEKALAMECPIFGICLGNQMLGIACGGKTKKMKYGHRGVNQPVGEISKKVNRSPSTVNSNKEESLKKTINCQPSTVNSKYARCIITSQNHGYEVDDTTLPDDFEVWFRNLNDNSVEGIRHKTKPIFAVQFHPEACSGPEDAEYLFDEFIDTL